MCSAEGELVRDSVVAKFTTTSTDGKTYQVDYHDFDVISIGYRLKSVRRTQFSMWATGILAMDDERLKVNGGGSYWKELFDRIRDMRSS